MLLFMDEHFDIKRSHGDSYWCIQLTVVVFVAAAAAAVVVVVVVVVAAVVVDH